jgi:hypothetical protein
VRVRHDCYCWWASDERKWEVRDGRIKENKNKGEEQEKEEEENRARYESSRSMRGIPMKHESGYGDNK